MGFKALLDKNLEVAFRQMKDLAVDAELIRPFFSEYDFTTKSASDFNGTYLIKVIELGSKVSGKDVKVTTKKFLMKTKNIPNLTDTDKLKIGNITYKFQFPIQQGENVTLAEAIKI